MTLTPLKAITFDFWGTLADAGYSYAERRIAYLARCLGHASTREAGEAYHQAIDVLSHVSAAGLALPATALVSVTLDALGTALPPERYAAVVRYWEEVILQDPPPPLPGIVDTLARIADLGLGVGLISDTGVSPGRSLRRVLSAAGLLRYFQRLTFSDEIGVTKRRPQPFLSTLAALRVRPEEALHVGDLPETDIAGARGVGMRAALLLQNSHRRDGASQADLVLERCADLPAGIRRWL